MHGCNLCLISLAIENKNKTYLNIWKRRIRNDACFVFGHCIGCIGKSLIVYYFFHLQKIKLSLRDKTHAYSIDFFPVSQTIVCKICLNFSIRNRCAGCAEYFPYTVVILAYWHNSLLGKIILKRKKTHVLSYYIERLCQSMCNTENNITSDLE